MAELRQAEGGDHGKADKVIQQLPVRVRQECPQVCIDVPVGVMLHFPDDQLRQRGEE